MVFNRWINFHFMNGFIRLVLLGFLPLTAWAQSSLPPCPPTGYKDNCLGSITFPNGQKYDGEFKNNKRNGQGTFTFPSGEKYVGEYKDDQPHGQGTSTFPNGEKYVGEFKDGKRNGRGTSTFAGGAKYVGEFKDDKRNGQGTFTFPSGAKYVGEFKNDQFNGYGSYAWPSGARYVGEWRDNQRSGLGIEYGADGAIITSGAWADGKIAKPGALERSRFPFDLPVASSPPRSVESDRTAVEAQITRQRQQELEQRLAAKVAEAEAAKRRQLELEAQLAAVQLPAQAPATAGSASVRSAHALVIGNAAYPGSARLDNPVNDASAISQKLRSMGFTVTTVTDANRQRLVQAMTQFRRSAAAADLSLLFYSGHGVQIFGANYILPTDVDQADTAQATIQGVRLNEVIENFMPGKTKIVFLDACRDNPLQRTGDRSVTKGLAPISVAEGTLISYATKDGQVAADGVGSRNSPFTQALLEHLNDPQDIGVVLRKVREKVMRATGGKQQPWDYGSLTGGELVLSAINSRR